MGHQVLGLACSDAGATSLAAAGAEVHRLDAAPLFRLALEKGAAGATGGGSTIQDKETLIPAHWDILQANPDLNGIFAINDPSALGAVAALEKAGKLSQVKVIGFDGNAEGKQAIKDGKIYADPIQFPDEIGKQTVQAIVKYMAGGDVPPQTLIATKLYKKADALKDPSLKAG